MQIIHYFYKIKFNKNCKINFIKMNKKNKTMKK